MVTYTIRKSFNITRVTGYFGPLLLDVAFRRFCLLYIWTRKNLTIFGQVFQVSGVWTSVDGLDLISTSEGRQLEHETGLYKISVWVLDLVSVPLSGFPVGI
ncbi:unnamed protein product [Rhizophagus irregularis]|nr:unnamed protein product [Rhizophagus irregularis]CAB4441330.1 unnamed protein product [Rhizophagus irregularis]